MIFPKPRIASFFRWIEFIWLHKMSRNKVLGKTTKDRPNTFLCGGPKLHVLAIHVTFVRLPNINIVLNDAFKRHIIVNITYEKWRL